MAKCSNFSEIEGKVTLKRSFQLTGNKNMVPLSKSPTYPGSHLAKVPLIRGPTYREYTVLHYYILLYYYIILLLYYIILLLYY